MKQEIVKDIIHLIADEGYLLQRIESKEIVGKSIYLGYSYYIGGKKLDTPHKDIVEDFEEVEDPNYDADSSKDNDTKNALF